MTRDLQVVSWARRHLGQPFRWGETDCCALAADLVRELTGEDIPYRWSNEEEARAIFRETRPSHELARRGWRSVPPIEAQPGDILVVETDAWPERLHVVLGKHSISSGPEYGVSLVRTADLQAVAAWRAP